MPQGDKSSPPKRKRLAGASGQGRDPKGLPNAETGARAWGAVNKLQGAGKNINARRKVPFGPVGGLGRKTNLARSS